MFSTANKVFDWVLIRKFCWKLSQIYSKPISLVSILCQYFPLEPIFHCHLNTHKFISRVSLTIWQIHFLEYQMKWEENQWWLRYIYVKYFYFLIILINSKLQTISGYTCNVPYWIFVFFFSKGFWVIAKCLRLFWTLNANIIMLYGPE